MTEEITNLKVAFIGDSGCGKTSLIAKFRDDSFNPYQEPTPGVTYCNKLLDLKGKKIRLNIWDISGQEKYESISALYCKTSDAFVIVCDLFSSNIEASLSKWYHKVKKENKSDDVPILIAINKIDNFSMESTLTVQKIEEFGDGLQIPVFKTSSKDNINVKELFNKLISAIMRTGSTFNKKSLTLSSRTHSQKIIEQHARGCCRT